LPRIDLGGGFSRPSADGGAEEFREFRPKRRFSSAFSASSSSSFALSTITSAASSSYDGG
jgi:hypothetical protein